MTDAVTEAFDTRVDRPRELKLEPIKQVQMRPGVHAHGFAIHHPDHGKIGEVWGEAGADAGTGHRPMNITSVGLDHEFVSDLGLEHETDAKGVLGTAGVRQLGRELRRHGFSHAWSDSRMTGLRSKSHKRHVDSVSLPADESVADVLITQQLSEQDGYSPKSTISGATGTFSDSQVGSMNYGSRKTPNGQYVAEPADAAAAKKFATSMPRGVQRDGVVSKLTGQNSQAYKAASSSAYSSAVRAASSLPKQ